MIPRNYFSRKCKGNYKFTKSLENINPLEYMDDIRFLRRMKKNLETLYKGAVEYTDCFSEEK